MHMFCDLLTFSAFMSFTLSTNPTELYMDSSTRGCKRNLDEMESSQTPTNFIATTPVQNLQPKQADAELDFNAYCRRCSFQHNYADRNQNLPIKIHGFSLVRLTEYPCDVQELTYGLRKTLHPYCVLFQLIVLYNLYDNMDSNWSATFGDKISIIKLIFHTELRWLTLVSIASASKDPPKGPILIVYGQPQYSNTGLNLGWLDNVIEHTFPDSLKNLLNLYNGKFVLSNPLVHTITGSSAVNFQEPPFNLEMCKKMLEHPFSFYFQLEKNLIKLKKINMYAENGENKVFQEIIEVIDVELAKIYIDESDQLENDSLKIFSIIFLIKALPSDCVKDFNIPFNKLPKVESDESFQSFQKQVYNIGKKVAIQWTSNLDPQTEGRENMVQVFINLIRYFKMHSNTLAELTSKQIELKLAGQNTSVIEMEMDCFELKARCNKRIILFWVAKLVLFGPFTLMPTLCYILYKTDLMKELSIYFVFRHAFIIKRLLLQNINRTNRAWFEQSSNRYNKSVCKLVFWKMMERESFLKEWETQQNKDHIPKLQQILNLENINETEQGILYKVYNLLSELYNDIRDKIEHVFVKNSLSNSA